MKRVPRKSRQGWHDKCEVVASDGHEQSSEKLQKADTKRVVEYFETGGLIVPFLYQSLIKIVIFYIFISFLDIDFI